MASILLPAAGGPSKAWNPEGHKVLTRAALAVMPSSLPAFLRAGGELAATASCDPDVAKNRGTPALRESEEPEHYVNVEYWKAKSLPATRYAFLRRCARERLDPARVGLLPYAVAEGTERLAIAFAEYRRSPHSAHVQAKCLLYAGLLAHYAQDLCQPLHVTVHYDGLIRADGTSPHTGIHGRVDALVERLRVQPTALAREIRVAPMSRLMPAIWGQVRRSRALVERTYELDGRVIALGASWTRTPDTAAFALERARESVRFTAALYATAWQQSARLRLPAWLQESGR